MKQTEKEYNVTIGKKLRESRIMCGLSQTELGDALGCTFQQIQKYEKGSNRISTYRLILWGKTTNKDWDYFVNGEDYGMFDRDSKSDLSLVRSLNKLSRAQKSRLLSFLTSIGESADA